MVKHKNSFIKDKNGSIESVLDESGKMILAGLLVALLLGYFVVKLYAAYSSDEDDGSKANFINLYNEISKLMQSSSTINYKVDNFYIGDDKILVGFDTNWDNTKTVADFGARSRSFNIYKPYKCGNSACICLFTTDWKPTDPSDRVSGVVECESSAFAGKNVIFLSEGQNVEPKTSGYPREDVGSNYLLYYGRGWNRNTQRLYIEKKYDTSQNRYHIYIAKINEREPNDPVYLRKKSIDDSRNS